MSLLISRPTVWTDLKSKWHDSGVLLVFILLTVFSLCLPGRNYNLLPITISCIVTVKYFIDGFKKNDNLTLINLFLLFYIILITISAIMHYAALRELGPSAYITVRPNDAKWGIEVNKIAVSSYLLFPLFLVVLINIFFNVDKPCELFIVIPVSFIPSLIVAYYQGLFDIHFLNATITKWLHEIAGLSYDFNGFRLSLFVLFPTSIFGVIICRNIWVRAGLGLFSIMVFILLVLSESRTALFGVLLYCISLPGIAIWVYGSTRINWRTYFLSLIIALSTLVWLEYIYYRHNGSAEVYSKHIQQKYRYFKKFGFKKTLIATFDKNSFIAKKAASRLEMGYYACILTSLSPLAGWGPGGFYRNLDNFRYQKIRQVQLFDWDLPLRTPRLYHEMTGPHKHFDNANNHYLQMSSDIGIFGALINIIMHVLPLWMVFKIRKSITGFKTRWIIGISFSTVCIMMILFLTGPHTFNIEVQWIFSCYLAILYVSALKFGSPFSRINIKLATSIFVIFTFIFTAATFDKTFGKNGYKSMRIALWWPLGADRNHYEIENWKEGPVIWCYKDAVIEIPLEYHVSGNLNLKLRVMHPDVSINPVTIQYGGKTGATHSMEIRDKLWKTINIPVISEYVLERSNPKKGFRTTQSLIFSFDVSRTWIPKEYGVSDDTRKLGVAVLVPELKQTQDESQPSKTRNETKK